MKFDSKLEKTIHSITKWNRYDKDPVEYTLRYIPDFEGVDADGNTFLCEAKGYFRVEAVRKMIQVFKDNPELDIRFVFQAPNSKVGGRKATTCAQFAEKYGKLWTDLPGLKKGVWYGK